MRRYAIVVSVCSVAYDCGMTNIGELIQHFERSYHTGMTVYLDVNPDEQDETMEHLRRLALAEGHRCLRIGHVDDGHFSFVVLRTVRHYCVWYLGQAGGDSFGDMLEDVQGFVSWVYREGTPETTDMHDDLLRRYTLETGRTMPNDGRHHTP